MIPLHIFRSRAFTGANLYTLFLYMALGGSFYFIPYLLINAQGYQPTAAGAALRVTGDFERPVGQIGVTRLGPGRHDAESRGLDLLLLFLAALTDQLRNGRHSVLRNAHESGRTARVGRNLRSIPCGGGSVNER